MFVSFRCKWRGFCNFCPVMTSRKTPIWMHFAKNFFVRHRYALAFHCVATPSAEAANVLVESTLRVEIPLTGSAPRARSHAPQPFARPLHDWHAKARPQLENDLQTESALAAASGSPHRGPAR